MPRLIPAVLIFAFSVGSGWAITPDLPSELDGGGGDGGAQTDPLGDCGSLAGAADLVIRACTALIDDGKLGNKDLSRAYNNRANAFRGKKETNKAIADLDKAIELDPRNTTPYMNRAKIFDLMGLRGRAIADYRKILEIEPNNRPALQELWVHGIEPKP